MASFPVAEPPAGQKPTRARYWVIVFAVTLAILAYIDRVCMSVAAPVISRDLGLSKAQMGMIFSAFGLGYALFEIPGGWLGDWLGPRSVLLRIVLWWSCFTAAMGQMWSFTSLWVSQFLFAAGEAGCFPNLTKSFTVWLPHPERVRAQGIMWMFARWGGAFTPPLVTFMLSLVSWRVTFPILGSMGLIWAFFFYRWFRDNPAEHKSVNRAELKLLEGAVKGGGHGDVPWGKLIASGSVWLLWAQYFLISYPWYFYITWLPTYLRENRHLSSQETGVLAILPLFCGGLGNIVSGLLAPRLARVFGSVKKQRRVVGTCGFLGAAACILMVTVVKDPIAAMLVMGLASFSNDIVMPGAWGACMDVGGKYAGTLAGSMNMMGNLAGFVAPTVGGLILQHTAGNWNLFLYTMTAAYLIGSLCWPFIDPVTPIDREGSSN
jgi:MFS family permease